MAYERINFVNLQRFTYQDANHIQEQYLNCERVRIVDGLPAIGEQGGVVFDIATKKFYGYNGIDWTELAVDASTINLNLSNVLIDDDKDWKGKNITGMGNINGVNIAQLSSASHSHMNKSTLDDINQGLSTTSAVSFKLLTTSDKSVDGVDIPKFRSDYGVHAHTGGDMGAQISYESLSNRPVLGTASQYDVGVLQNNIPLIDESGKLDATIVPRIASVSVYVAETDTDMLALTALQGDICTVVNESRTYVLTNNFPDVKASWMPIVTPSNFVQMVNGKSGNEVTLDANDIMIDETMALSDRVVEWDAKASGDTLQKAYPVGSLYLSTVATDPATLFGFGTWVAFGEGRVLLGAGGAYAAGATGGVETVALTVDNLPPHAHAFTPSGMVESHSHDVTLAGAVAGAGVVSGTGTDSGVSASTLTDGLLEVGGEHDHTASCSSAQPAFTGSEGVTGETGSGTAHDNMPPYVAVYVWNRTA